jgi:hypothetical protein
MTPQDDVAAFLAARLDEDEAAARPLIGMPGALTAFGAVAQFVAGNGPARALREVAAKRMILEAHRRVPTDSGLAFAVYRLAAAYSGHPDYRQEWA